MAKEIMNRDTIEDVFRAVPHILSLPAEKFWVDYDKEADVLYISFRRPQKATDSEMLEGGVVLRYHGDDIVGLTILDASKRQEKPVSDSKTH